MSKAQLVISAVVLEGRSKSKVVRDYAIAKVPAVSTIWRILNRRGFVPGPTNGPTRPGNAFKPNCPINAGKPISPTGAWPITPRWRLSTSSTTTPGSPSPATPDPSRPAPMSWTPSTRPSPTGAHVLA